VAERTLHAAFAARLDVDARTAGRAVRVPGGTLLRSPRFPNSWDLNQVVLDPGAGPAEVAAAIETVERELEGAAHRRISIFAPGAPVQAPDGWELEEQLIMLFPETAPTPAWPPEVTTVGVEALREPHVEMWRLEGMADVAEELADMQLAFGHFPGSRPLAARDGGGRVLAWAQLANGSIDDVWVWPDERGRGLGRALTAAAVAAGGWFLGTDVTDPRPQGLYRSLGFEERGRLVQLTRHAG
jgi:ribosomal protein S18 acetylase RimI-like enzyme